VHDHLRETVVVFGNLTLPEEEFRAAITLGAMLRPY
jgi:hypothetical protein